MSDAEPLNANYFPPFLKNLLDKRGLTDPAAADIFLKPNYARDTHDPFLLKDMAKVVDRLVAAIESGERIVIYSDYDADGIPGAVVLHDFFKKIGFTNFENYIPDRHLEGFGVNLDAVENIATRGAKLMITIDCGITDVVPITRARELGIETIITDHHEPTVGVAGTVDGATGPAVDPSAGLPPAFAILNPKQAGCEYPFKFLCGAGVIYKLIQAILQKKTGAPAVDVSAADAPGENKNGINWNVKPGWEKWLLDMVGLATLSDMVPLTGENRVFAYYGLTVLRKSPRLGLMKLLHAAKTAQKTMTEDDVNFTITPRINAASRMGVPKDAFELLATSDEIRAGELITYLNKINDERKGLVAAITKEVRQTISEREKDGRLQDVIVMGHAHWRPAVLGLVANSLKDDHDRPVFLWGKENGSVIKGSCRSDGRVSVVDLMESSRDLFITFGGHKMSGGFAIDHEKIHGLEEMLSETYRKLRAATEADAAGVDTKGSGGPGALGADGIPNDVDSILTVDDLTWGNYAMIEKLAPYGVGNPKPVFLFKDVQVAKIKPFGKTKNHIEISFANSWGDNFNAISFFTKPNDPLQKVSVGDTIQLKACLEKSFFKKYPELRLRIVSVVV